MRSTSAHVGTIPRASIHSMYGRQVPQLVPHRVAALSSANVVIPRRCANECSAAKLS
jgi:hypothetical protein